MSETNKNNGTSVVEKPTPVSARRVIYTPQVDILELPGELVLLVDMPGVVADSVEVHFERGELIVRGQQRVHPLEGKLLVQEFEPGDFYRAFLISQEIAADQISAELKHGVLTIHLPKSAAAQPRRITVKS